MAIKTIGYIDAYYVGAAPFAPGGSRKKMKQQARSSTSGKRRSGVAQAARRHGATVKPRTAVSRAQTVMQVRRTGRTTTAKPFSYQQPAQQQYPAYQPYPQQPYQPYQPAWPQPGYDDEEEYWDEDEDWDDWEDEEDWDDWEDEEDWDDWEDEEDWDDEEDFEGFMGSAAIVARGARPVAFSLPGARGQRAPYMRPAHNARIPGEYTYGHRSMYY